MRQLGKALLQAPRAQELEEATLVLRGRLAPCEQPQPLLAPPALDLAPTLHRHPLRLAEPRSSPQPKLQLLLERDRIVVLAVLGAEDQGDCGQLSVVRSFETASGSRERRIDLRMEAMRPERDAASGDWRWSGV